MSEQIKVLVEKLGNEEVVTVFGVDSDSEYSLNNEIDLAKDQGRDYFVFDTISFSDDIKKLRESIDSEYHRLRELAAIHEGIDTSDNQKFMFWFPSEENPYNSTLKKLEKAHEGLL